MLEQRIAVIAIKILELQGTEGVDIVESAGGAHHLFLGIHLAFFLEFGMDTFS